MRTHLFIAAMFALSVAATPARACDSLEACLALYPETATEGSGVGRAGGDLADQVRAYGPDAIPHLLDLLTHEDPGVQRLAGYTLNTMSGFEPEHLEPLVRAMEGGNGWVPPAIARIGTPEAIDALARHLREYPQTQTQVTWAFEILGETGAPWIAEMYACPDDCDEGLFNVASFVLHELGEDALGVIPRLLEIAEDEQFHPMARRHAVWGIGRIGPSAAGYVPDLLALRERQAALGPQVDHALFDIGSPEAVPALLRALPFDAAYVLNDIGRLGTPGYEAGPAVLGYLNDPEWDIRVTAADALGHIGYSPAASDLANVLTNEDDWKLVYAASLSLGRLRADDQIEDLTFVRDNHWYPPVREIAATALRNIESSANLDEIVFWQESVAQDAPEACRAVVQRAIEEPVGTKRYATDDEEALQALSYQAAIYSYGPPEGTEPNESGLIEVTAENMVEHVDYIEQVPDLALRVSDGWLVGADRGEWGGELVYVSETGESDTLYHDNIEDVFFVGDQLVATSGIAHMVYNEGLLLRIDRAADGSYIAEPWKRLPAAPRSSWLVEGGELLINTYGGSVVISPDGALRMADCVSE